MAAAEVTGTFRSYFKGKFKGSFNEIKILSTGRCAYKICPFAFAKNPSPLLRRAGETYDNAFVESLFSRYKAELLEGGSFAHTEEARMETFQYIDGYYNPLRKHSSIGYKSPLAFETNYRQRTENRAVFSFLTPNSIDNNSTKGVKLKQHSLKNLLAFQNPALRIDEATP